jgi:guanylate kinase
MTAPSHVCGGAKAPPARRGLLFIVSAPSGAGKTTLCRALRQRFPDLVYSVSHTTRLPRPGEEDGKDYHFISRAEFEKGVTKAEWAEWARVHDNYYGTSARFLDHARAEGRDLLLDIDVQGTRQIIERYPESVTIFIMPPSLAVLRRRLQGRGTDAAEAIERRIAAAATEMDQRHLYRHVVINDDLAAAEAAFIGIVDQYRARA